MPLILPLIFGAIAIFASLKQSEALKKSWNAAARQLDIDADVSRGNRPEISGSVDGVSVRVHMVKAGDDWLTSYVVRHHPVGPPVKIMRQGPFAPLARWLGKRDVEVGRPRFDDKVMIDSDHPEQVQAFLTPSRQAAVLAIFDRWTRAEITHDEIRVRTPRAEKSPEVIVNTVRQLVAIAQVMGRPAELDNALSLQQHGDLGRAIDELHGINERNPNEFTQMLEAEALIEHGEHERAGDLIAPTFEASGHETEGWRRLANTPSPVLLPAPQVDTVVSDVGQQQVIDDLFGGALMSFEIVERFEQMYVNNRVGWGGTVTQLHSYRHDNDFGEGPGVKATLLLGTAGASSLISTEVHAVVQFGADVELERGTEVSFVATLQHVDRFARKLYLSSGALT